MTQQLVSHTVSPETHPDDIALLRANIQRTLEDLADEPPRMIDGMPFSVSRWPNQDGFRVSHGDNLWIMLNGGYIIEGSYDRSAPDPKLDLARLLQQAQCVPSPQPDYSTADLSETNLFLGDKYSFTPRTGTLGSVFTKAIETIHKEQHVLGLTLQAIKQDLARSREVREDIAALENHLLVLIRAQEGLDLDIRISDKSSNRLLQNLLDWRGESAKEMAKRIWKSLESKST